MFAEKVRRTIRGDFNHKINFSSWAEFTMHMPYKAWSNYKPLMWNITEESIIQLIYMANDTLYEMKEIKVNINGADEQNVRKWLSEQIWVN